MKHYLAAAACALMLASAPLHAQEAAEANAGPEMLGELSRAQFNALVRDYLLENPEVIVEAMDVLQARQAEAEATAAREAMAANHDRLFNNPITPATGAEEPAVTVVEFFDYNCGYCKRVFEAVVEVQEANPDVRVVWKEFPILSESSRTAALVALAADRQDKYMEMHTALMTNRGALSDDVIFSLAEGVGLDMDKLRADMIDPALNQHLLDNRRLAEALRISGTPALIVGDELIPGAIPRERLQQLVDEARES